jgi:hypothetical protein
MGGIDFNIGKCVVARGIPLATTHCIARYYGNNKSKLKNKFFF